MSTATTSTCEIVIPCFEESARLPAFLESLTTELEKRPWHVRITVVDDGSNAGERQRTLDAIAPIMARHPSLMAPPLLLPENIGKGGAVYAAWRQTVVSGADLLCFVDADGATSAAELCRLIEHAMGHRDTVDAVYGSRVKMLGKEIHRSLRRHLVGRCFATMASVSTGIDIYDSQCGAKVVSSSAFLAIEGALKETDFVFDVELTLALMQKGFRIVEVPISWKDVPGGKVRMIRDIWRMAMGLIRIRANHGTYVPGAVSSPHA